MQRVVILGCSGSGKSTLARRLGEKLGLPVVHLDALFWLPGWVERDRADFRQRVAQAVSGDRWVCDGGYSKTYDLRFPRADVIVWLERPRWLCLLRVTTRLIKHWRRTRPDMGPGCPEKVDLAFYLFIWNWERRTRPKIEAGLAHYAPNTPRIVLTSDAAVEAFLSGP
jgi:adenylate kinase family enzyme